MEIDVIIPVYKPGKELFTLAERLQRQTIPVRAIILMNTEEKYFARLIYGTRFLEQYKNIQVHHLSKQEFDHGGTRRRGVKKSKADIFVMMTQDAVPADEFLLERLITPLKDKVAVSYARQLPREDCKETERIIRQFNYPEQSCIKGAEDVERLGIKAFFCSNVCAAYRRDIYEELGGFVRHTIFNEDMIYAAAAIKAGYQVAYAADARVFHSHNYTNSQQFHRNFDLGVSQADFPEVFADVPSEGEGMRMVRQTAAQLKARGMGKEICHLYIQSACKYAGYLLGKHYRKLPCKLTAALSDNKEYWRQESMRREAAGIDSGCEKS